MPRPNYPMMEFHVSRQAREKYNFDDNLFTLNGNVIFANFHAARVFAQKINQKRDLLHFPEQAIKSGDINALGLIDEILHLVVSQYRQRHPGTMSKLAAVLEEKFGKSILDQALSRFALEFPPVAVHQRRISLDAYINGSTGGVSHREVLLEEMLMLWITNANPACTPFKELFEDSSLDQATSYKKIIEAVGEFFKGQPHFGPDNQPLVDLLRSPAIMVPNSLSGQLEYIRTRWSQVIGSLLYRLLSSLDLIKEEEKLYYTGLGQPPTAVYEFSHLAYEPERFTPDKDWMPSLVLLAKNAYVWLYQLSKKLNRSLTRLDEIPESELEQLGSRGFTGLWLIGVWERSPASQHIKQLRGNPEAVASAYSLFDYSIANDLGGDDAYRVLRDRAWKYGVRLASDMVPNHMGVDSRWVIEHPDWFVSLDHSPYPSYSFNGPNLSWDNRVGLFIEDHYFNNTDAAVVFKRADYWSGQESYIYHGNDGTSMPWNDTAQLNYLLPEVREAVIQTILHVARKFPVIRFDAAMTLAKRHYQRLWFPEPGSGGDIPSRAEHGLTKGQFDAAMPVEFWREVVDRVAQEVPDTLLLAEAFWLMEGYFVRTLGMHRVYNSAFMNMMRDEKNQEYRQVIKNTLEFDPEILKRYVNFMNNPDERTAEDQFGKGDKYFGICILMATLPGLPMFGHGQVEGYTEKYGMEYRRAYKDEVDDQYLVDRHVREVFPLLRKRYLFAEANDFLLYDFIAGQGNNTPEGYVIEDVFAYSNQAGSEKALVIYHNKFARASGWIRSSTAYPVKTGEIDENGVPVRSLIRKSLAQGLELTDTPDRYTVFRDQITGLEYLRNNNEIHSQGLFISLEAYQYHVFTDFREVEEDPWHQYSQLAVYLNGRGVPSVEEALKEIFLQAVHYPLREILNSGFINWFVDNRETKDEPAVMAEKRKSVVFEFEEKMSALLQSAKHMLNLEGKSASVTEILSEEARAILHLTGIEKDTLPPAKLNISSARAKKLRKMFKYLVQQDLRSGSPKVWHSLVTWLVLHRIGSVINEQQAADISRSWIDEWLLSKIAIQAGLQSGLSEREAWNSMQLVRLLITHQNWYGEGTQKKKTPIEILNTWLADQDVQRLLGINRYQGVLWYNKESLETWLWWMFVVESVNSTARTSEPENYLPELLRMFDLIEKILKCEKKSGYQVERLLSGCLTA